MSDEKRTLVEEGTELSGTIRSTCPVTVRGVVEGELAAPSLEITPTGRVKGDVRVDALVSEGEIAGTFRATAVRLSGVVRDDTVIHAKTLEVRLSSDDGFVVAFGRTTLEVGDASPHTTDADRLHRG